MFRKYFGAYFRRRLAEPATPHVVMAWYTEEQWSLLRQVSVDADQLEPTHAEWLKGAEAKCDSLLKSGTRVDKVTLDVNDLAAWCREMGRPVNSESRALYAVFCFKNPTLGHGLAGAINRHLRGQKTFPI